MSSKYLFILRELSEKVWVRVIGFAVLAIVAAVLARFLSPYLGDDIALKTGADAVTDVLGILTSSMLAVTIFSLSIAVAAFASASTTGTPRATVLLQRDHTTQNVLATFLGAFLFGLVGWIATKAEFYDESGQVVMFVFAIVVIGLVVVALIRWISHLMAFGRMSDTLDRVERAVSDALRHRLEQPFLGGRPLIGAAPQDGTVVTSQTTGYVQHVDMASLQEYAENADVDLFVHGIPGTFVALGTPLLSVGDDPGTEVHEDALRRACTIDKRRTFVGDPRFGLVVLTEIASRALSPAVNDPGTAIDIVGRHVRILSMWDHRTASEPVFDRVFVLAVTVKETIEDAFRPIARDGSSLLEVHLGVQKALAVLSIAAPEVFASACAQMADEVLQRAEAASLLPLELELIREAASPARQAATHMQTPSMSRSDPRRTVHQAI